MERPKLPGLPEGLVWRKKDDESGEYFEQIYFKKQYRNRTIRGSSGTNDPEEAARRLRKKLDEIDNLDFYGKAPDRTFREGAKKLLEAFKGSDATLRMYAQQADLLDPHIGDVPLRLICKDTLEPFVEARTADGVSVRTINLGIEFVRVVLRRAAHYWRENGIPWIVNCPIIPFEKGPRKQPYPLSWHEQEVFFDLLPGRKRKMALFDVHTGLRDKPLVNLQWSWEQYEEALGETVFKIPAKYMKNGKPMTLILNRIARQVIESMRGYHEIYVFGKASRMTDNAWHRAWKDAGLPTGKEWCKGVHNLRHTFGKRLRDAGVDSRDVQDLLHHMPRDITRHYSAPELKKLKAALEKIVPKPQLVAGSTVGPKVAQEISGAQSTASEAAPSTS